MKKRIMLCGEATYLSTGFATLGYELLKRWHASGKYEVCEFSSYAAYGDPRNSSRPWPIISCMPNPGEEQLYNSNPTNQFGEWKFEEACLKYKPHIVVDLRDWWYLEYQNRSPFRPYFHWVIQPTVDAQPQDEKWLATYLDADAVFTYTDWAIEVLKRQTGGRMKIVGSAPPGADTTTYQPVSDRRAHRQNVGVNPDALVVGTVMRNQRRKLYPDLIEAFALFLKRAPERLRSKTFLYLHTSWPDLGWDIPRLIKEAGIGHKVLMSYFCKACGVVFPSFFGDSIAACRKCGRNTATFPNSQVGVSTQVLSGIISLFDCYVQYANSEGLGMPQVEAAACGVPVFAVDYSAMSDVVRKLHGIPVKVQRLVRENDTHCLRAYPDNEDLADKLINFLLTPESVRLSQGFRGRKAVEEHYSWDKTATKWMDYFDSVKIPPVEQTWESSPKIHRPATDTDVPSGLTDEQFVRWGMQRVVGRPDLVNSYMAMRMTQDITWGMTVPSVGGLWFNEASLLSSQQRPLPFGREQAMKVFLGMCEKRNLWERKRCGL